MKKIYAILFKPSTKKQIRKIPRDTWRTIHDRIKDLAHDPFPPGVKALADYDDYYRIRVGNFRVLYEVDTDIRIILIIRIGDRKDIYKKL